MTSNCVLEKNFPILKDFLHVDSRAGICFNNSMPTLWGGAAVSVSPPKLKYYFADESTTDIIQHNIRWAKGNEEKPRFQFVYLMLPNRCNQKCHGCFTGQDKEKLPSQLNGDMYSDSTLEMIFSFLKEHSIKTIVYGGGGELFTWNGAFNYIDKVHENGFRMVIFTNGTLLNREQVKRLNSYKVSLIVSIRDTIESKHNECVNFNGFFNALKTIEYALEEDMHVENRLAVEIPVTKNNQERILKHLLPTLRALNIVPLIEEYIPISTSLQEEDKSQYHTFDGAREFFLKACAIDRALGYKWDLEYGQRILSQPKCERPRYSFAIYPSGGVIDCPCGCNIKYGNFYSTPLHNVIYSETFKKRLVDFDLCACSVFYTKNVEDVKKYLPKHLEDFR